MITKLKGKLQLWYRQLFWTPEDHWAHIHGLKRRRFEGDKELMDRIIDRLQDKGGW